MTSRYSWFVDVLFTTFFFLTLKLSFFKQVINLVNEWSNKELQYDMINAIKGLYWKLCGDTKWEVMIYFISLD